MSSARDVTVLVVGDLVADVASGLTEESVSLDVVRAENATDARAALAEDIVDIIVSTYDLPDRDGVALLAEVRRHYPTLPFVLCTVDGRARVASAAIEHDVTAYIPHVLDGDVPDTLETQLLDIVADYRDSLERRRDSARLDAILENTTDVIITVDAEGVVRDVNDAVEAVLGYQPGNLIGHPLATIIPPNLVTDHTTAFERYLRTGEQQLDWQDIQLSAEHADGHTVPVSVSFAEFTVDSGHYFTGIIRDITSRVESKARLEQQNERLDEFTSVVSHDLRNPINIARGNIQLVQEDVDDDRLGTALDALGTMNDIVTALLALARLGDVADDPEAIELRELATEVWWTIGPDTATLTPADDAPIVVGDRRAIRQLIMNLFQNAVDHGGPDVTVTLGSIPTGFFVADDGVGIPPERRDDVLQPGRTTSDTGTGFGLSIVNRVADAHDWTVTITESETGGARFEITDVECREDRAADER